MLTGFQNSCTGRLTGKFATNSYLNIQSHLKCVAKYLCSKNSNAQEVIEAKCHVRLRPLKKTVLKYLSGKIFLS